jgi:predicted DNA-binding ribbon-helix-helix protein
MTLRRHSVRINGHRTSISIEDAFWDELKRIAAARGKSSAALIAEIDRARANEDPPPNLSSALRLHVLAALKSSG